MSTYSKFSDFEACTTPGPHWDHYKAIMAGATQRFLPATVTIPWFSWPRELGGPQVPQNLVYLTVHEAVAAFRYLIEATTGDDREVLTKAAWTFLRRVPGGWANMDSDTRTAYQQAGTMLTRWLQSNTKPVSLPKGPSEIVGGGPKGVPKSPEHRAKISDALKGENHPNFGKTTPPATRKKMSRAKNPNGAPNKWKGATRTPEQKARILEGTFKGIADKKKQASGQEHPIVTLDQDWITRVTNADDEEPEL